jgi:hypothetical protein
MKALSLEKVVEGLAYADADQRNLAGSIDYQDRFLENVDRLRLLHSGVFCFLAFHPWTDPSVASYIEAGSLASDAGPDILVLFLSKTAFTMPRTVTGRDLELGVTLDTASHPAYKFVEWLFPADYRPSLPGLVVFDNLFDVFDSVYVPLPDQSTLESVAQSCRKVFTILESVFRQKKQPAELNFDAFCWALDKAGIRYHRTGSHTFLTWVGQVIGWTKKHGGEMIVAVLKKALGT